MKLYLAACLMVISISIAASLLRRWLVFWHRRSAEKLLCRAAAPVPFYVEKFCVVLRTLGVVFLKVP